ncbi:MAG: DUF2339 domain-containing protein [Paludibacteraceae bacterium]|nr:DUF2339 domain-containing protein [Paludibacteraceae bacterium]
MEDITKEITRLEEELSCLKKEHQTISTRLDELKKELNWVIPNLTRLSQSLSEEETNFLSRLTQLQEQMNLLKENCKEIEYVETPQEAPLIEDLKVEEENSETETAPQSAAFMANEESDTLIDTSEEQITEPNISGTIEMPCEEVLNEQPYEQTIEQTIEQTKEQSEVQSEMSSEEQPENVQPTGQKKKESATEDIFPTVDWEKFIGENLISKLGILILLIGVGIGGKYAIDHEMLSPAVRIILGTVFGLALQGVALKLKKEYKKFSAILSSGSSAILYFMTYFAYAFYDLIPRPLAFILMVLITAFSIFTAWWYDMEIVAIIGQVGAYIIPVILSDGSGSVLSLWTYIALINAGILVVSIRKYWQKLFAITFISTWLVVVISYRLKTWETLSQCYSVLALIFAFFAIFYFSTLYYKVKKDFEFVRFDIIFLLSNSFLFFAIGYHLIHNHEEMSISLPLFAIINAVIHCGVFFLLHKKQLVDQALQRLILALGVLFFTVAIAIGTSGHWITIFWMMEALALFWVGRTKQKAFYENMAYPILLIALLSLMGDWGNPSGAAFRPLTWLATMFAEWRSVWDAHPHAEQGVVLPWVTTVISLFAAGAFLLIDNYYPSAEKDEMATKKTKVFNVIFIAVLTLSFFVHFSQPGINILLALECALAFYFARKKENQFLEKIVYGLIALTTLCFFIHTISSISDYKDGSTIAMFMRNVIPSSISYVLSLAAIVFIDRMIPCKESELSTNFAFIIRGLWIYAIAFSCFVICYPYLHMPVNNLVFLWTTEVVAFIFVARYFKQPIYEKSLLPLLFLLLIIWAIPLISTRNELTGLTILASLFFIAGIFATLWINKQYEISYSKKLADVLQCTISVLVLILGIRIITHFSDKFSAIYAFDFAVGALALTTFLASKKNLKMLAKFDLVLLFLAVIMFLLAGLNHLSDIRERMLSNEETQSIFLGQYLFVRYLSIAVMAGAIAVFVYYRNSPYYKFGMKESEKKVCFDTILVIIGLAIGTSELFNIFNLMHYKESYKLALSIFWGCCSMFLIYFGLFKQMKHLRIDGFILFGVTILKLFFYDLRHLDTLAKTIVFVSLGILLLVSSFFYQRIAKEQQKLEEEQKKEVEEAESNVE